MLWEFKQGNNTMETYVVYGQEVISDWQVKNCFAKFHFGELLLENEPRPKHSSDFDDELQSH